jgi:hypothetical protein
LNVLKVTPRSRRACTSALNWCPGIWKDMAVARFVPANDDGYTRKTLEPAV